MRNKLSENDVICVCIFILVSWVEPTLVNICPLFKQFELGSDTSWWRFGFLKLGFSSDHSGYPKFQFQALSGPSLLFVEWFAKVPWLPWITLRYFPLFMLSSASAVVVPYPLSWWKVIHLLCQLQKEASVFETFIYWAQKYTVTIYLNENTSLYLLR